MVVSPCCGDDLLLPSRPAVDRVAQLVHRYVQLLMVSPEHVVCMMFLFCTGIITELYPKARRQSQVQWDVLITRLLQVRVVAVVSARGVLTMSLPSCCCPERKRSETLGERDTGLEEEVCCPSPIVVIHEDCVVWPERETCQVPATSYVGPASLGW